VPDDSDAPVARFASGLPARLVPVAVLGDPLRFLPERGCTHGLLHRRPHRMELVIPGHLLGQLAAAIVLEDDEVPDQGQEPLALAHPFEHHLQLGNVRSGQRLARDRAPRLEPLASGGGRRSCSPSTTVNWLTTSQSLFAGFQ